MKTILFAGGGTLGPVTPLLAVLRYLRQRETDINFVWVGTNNGPERDLLDREGIPFFVLPTAKLPRYPSFGWFSWPFQYLRARSKAREILDTTRPSLIVSAGGFTAVPLMRMAARRGVSCAIHQLDLEPGLSNRSVAKMCQSITTSFAYDIQPFSNLTSERVPTPCRFASQPQPTRAQACQALGLDDKHPVVFVVGGGTGAKSLNEALWNILPKLLEQTQVLHMTGKGKSSSIIPSDGGTKDQSYIMREFLDEQDMLNAYCAADLIVSRAGMGAISELACLSKSAILVPLPDSHQEKNAAAMPYPVVKQGQGFEQRLLEMIQTTLADPEQARQIASKAHDMLPTDDGKALGEIWMKLLVL